MQNRTNKVCSTEICKSSKINLQKTDSVEKKVVLFKMDNVRCFFFYFFFFLNSNSLRFNLAGVRPVGVLPPAGQAWAGPLRVEGVARPEGAALGERPRFGPAVPQA